MGQEQVLWPLPGLPRRSVRRGWKPERSLHFQGKVPIKRHVKVRAAANPYDPKWEQYFEKRVQAKMADRLQGKRRLLYLWQARNGVCPVCQEKPTKETDWEQDHIEPRVEGDSDTADNPVLLHPTCHRQVHSLGLTVLWPRSTKGR